MLKTSSIRSAIVIEYHLVTDRQTDKQTVGQSTYHTMHALCMCCVVKIILYACEQILNKGSVRTNE